jgi:hypothetical protein
MTSGSVLARLVNVIYQIWNRDDNRDGQMVDDTPAPPALPPIDRHEWKIAAFSAICGFLLIIIAWVAPHPLIFNAAADNTAALSDHDFLRYRWPLIAVGMAMIMSGFGLQVAARL